MPDLPFLLFFATLLAYALGCRWVHDAYTHASATGRVPGWLKWLETLRCYMAREVPPR